MRSAHPLRRIAAAASAVAVIAALAACTSDPSPAPSPSPSASERPSPTPAGPPELDPDGGAVDNLGYFDHVNRTTAATEPGVDGRVFIDALVAAGFDKAAMQVTADRTTLGSEADSVQFSVTWKGECLIGQYGPGSDGYQSAVQPELGTSGCLIGATRPIDW
ncbi:DUF6993 domain-containing protein [Agromyces archimandritae]|uniref:DUF6993 domain-containing protein n=1 Tax=Agromyces archimandritae TaxID=2781962 RepID=A0A975FLX6_9MICO|nr:hypothetical protein [Agromyces archimandritae]QTX04540.1 hypothetical protein G127AT_14960 [Agromyces archimandritae]